MFPVIIRLVLPDQSEEWRPAKAFRWTPSGAVMVSWETTPGDPRSSTAAWLPVSDVARVLRRPNSKHAQHNR